MRTRLRVTGSVMALGCAFALLPLWTAHAEPSAGEVTVALPAKIVLDGSPVPVTVSGAQLDQRLDVVAVGLYDGDTLEAMGGVTVGKTGSIAPGTLAPGDIVGRADLATAPCEDAAAGGCQAGDDGAPYRVVDSLTFHASSASVAKYGSKVALTATRTGRKVVWSAQVRRWDGAGWVDWAGCDVHLGSHVLQAGDDGVATLTTRTRASHSLTASVAETAAVWGASSPQVASKKGRGGAATPEEVAGFRAMLQKAAAGG